MHRDFIRDAYYDYSSKLGNRAVALSLSGLAVVWVFKTETESGPWLSGELLLPSVFFVLSLALDFFQTAYGVFAFGALVRSQDRAALLSGNPDFNDPDFKTPRWINWPTILMFYGKFGTCVVGYVLLLSFVIGRFRMG